VDAEGGWFPEAKIIVLENFIEFEVIFPSSLSRLKNATGLHHPEIWIHGANMGPNFYIIRTD
jgi:hypothetical protein